MKTRNKIFLLLICLNCVVVLTYGRELPDTFHITKADIKYYDDISFIRENIRDSIENPKAYLFTDGEYGISIAIKKENEYVVFNIAQREKSVFNNFMFERKDINLTGNDELIIYERHHDWYFNHRGQVVGSSLRMLVWDLDLYSCLLNYYIRGNYHLLRL
jgi:hypothetical protein